MLLACARLDIPAVFVLGGVMDPYLSPEGEMLVACDVKEAVGACKAGKITAEQLEAIETHACSGHGGCNMMGTAITMCCVTESLGLALPGNATIRANSGDLRALADEAGRCVVSLLHSGTTARSFISEAALENAARVALAIGGSSNLLLHLPAVAGQAGVSLDLNWFEHLSKTTPLLARLKPASRCTVSDFHSAGGVPAVLAELNKAGLLRASAPTLTGAAIACVLLAVSVDDPGSRSFLTATACACAAAVGRLTAARPPSAIELERERIVLRAERSEMTNVLATLALNTGQAGRTRRGDRTRAVRFPRRPHRQLPETRRAAGDAVSRRPGSLIAVDFPGEPDRGSDGP